MRILLADDEKELSNALVAILKHNNYSVDAVYDGQDALEYVISGKNEWITSIRNQTSRLDKLVKNLLMLSKMNEDDIKLVFSDFNLSDIVFETAVPFKVIAEKQKIAKSIVETHHGRIWAKSDDGKSIHFTVVI